MESWIRRYILMVCAPDIEIWSRVSKLIDRELWRRVSPLRSRIPALCRNSCWACPLSRFWEDAAPHPMPLLNYIMTGTFDSPPGFLRDRSSTLSSSVCYLNCCEREYGFLPLRKRLTQWTAGNINLSLHKEDWSKIFALGLLFIGIKNENFTLFYLEFS